MDASGFVQGSLHVADTITPGLELDAIIVLFLPQGFIRHCAVCASGQLFEARMKAA